MPIKPILVWVFYHAIVSPPAPERLFFWADGCRRSPRDSTWVLNSEVTLLSLLHRKEQGAASNAEPVLKHTRGAETTFKHSAFNQPVARDKID